MHGHGPYSWAAFLACLLLMDLPMLRADPALLPLLYLGVTAQVEGKASPKALVLVKKKKKFFLVGKVSGEGQILLHTRKSSEAMNP